MRVQISWPRGSLTVRVDDEAFASALRPALPLEAVARTWGEEVYFRVPVLMALRPDACAVVDPGTVCFWVSGQSVAIPYGATPISQAGECRLVEAVNIIGRIEENMEGLRDIRDGDALRLAQREG